MIEALLESDAPNLTFVYSDAKNRMTQRTVRPLGVLRMKNGDGGVRAMCTLRGALRTFGLGNVCDVLSVDGKPDSCRVAFFTTLDAPLQRLKAAERFAGMISIGVPFVPAALAPAVDALASVNQTLTYALAWKDKDGRPRLDVDVNAAGALAVGTGHAALARKAALWRAATALFATVPPEATMVAWTRGRTGWTDTGARWIAI